MESRMHDKPILRFWSTRGLHRSTMCRLKVFDVIGLQKDPWRYIIWDTKYLKITPLVRGKRRPRTSFHESVRVLKQHPLTLEIHWA